jgi:anaerobic selenocysteine-containing dehydrogenase
LLLILVCKKQREMRCSLFPKLNYNNKKTNIGDSMLETISLKRKPGTRKSYDQVVTACCQECAVGCGLLAYVKDDRIVDIQGNENHPVSKGRLCARGIAFMQGLTAPDRITLPSSRNRLMGPFEAFDNWEQGIDLLAERLRRTKDQYGAESLVIACDPEAGLDFYLGAQRFARLWGTPHVYHPSQEAADAALPAALRHPTVRSAQWSQSRCLVLVEADLAATHPVAFQQVLEAQRSGTKIIAVDSRFTATLAKADTAVLIKPNKGNDVGLALMKVMLEEQLIDSAAVEAKATDFQALKASYATLPMERLEAATGLSSEKISNLARTIARRQPAVWITAKRLAFVPNYAIWSTLSQAMEGQNAAGGWYPLESGIPQMDPTFGLDDVQPAVSRCDTVAFPYQPNNQWNNALDNIEVQALIGSGNCLTDFMAPLQKRVKDMDLTIYFGSFPNQTRQAAHMVFPRTAWAERDGISFTNEGAVQWSPRIVKPNDACRTGLGFWMRLAQRLGWDDYFPWQKANGMADHKAFYQELFKKNSCTAELQMDSICQENALVYWSQDITADAQSKAALLSAPADAAVAPDVEDPSAYPLDFHATRAMTRSGDASHWWPWTKELEDEMGIQIHPLVATALKVENGETIVVASEDQTIEGPAYISRMVTPRLVWSLQRMRADHVLVYRKGQAPEEARELLKAI